MTDRLDPKRTAFLIMDYQGDILKNVESQVPTLLANAKRALAAARAAKMPVFHVKVAFRPGHPEVSPNNVGFSAAKSANRLVLGTPGAEIHPDVAAIDGEPTIVKHRISPMIDTDLPTLLRAREVNHLVMCGVSVMQLAHGQQLTVRQTEFAQTTSPQTDTPKSDTPSVPAGNTNGPAEAKPGGTRPTTPPPEPARPDEQQQKMSQKPALPPAPAEKMGEPVQK